MKKIILFLFIVASTNMLAQQSLESPRVDTIVKGINLSKDKLDGLREYILDIDLIKKEKISAEENKQRLDVMEAELKKMLTADQYQLLNENRKKVK